MFDIPQSLHNDREYIKMPDLKHLAAMKVHAIAQRAKRKDYVDMYFLIKKFGIQEIITYTKAFF